MTKREILGRVFFEIQQSKDLTQQDFAASLGVTGAHMSKIQAGKNLPGPDLLLATIDRYGHARRLRSAFDDAVAEAATERARHQLALRDEP